MNTIFKCNYINICLSFRQDKKIPCHGLWEYHSSLQMPSHVKLKELVLSRLRFLHKLNILIWSSCTFLSTIQTTIQDLNHVWSLKRSNPFTERGYIYHEYPCYLPFRIHSFMIKYYIFLGKSGYHFLFFKKIILIGIENLISSTIKLEDIIWIVDVILWEFCYFMLVY